jgi:hypothetical protein
MDYLLKYIHAARANNTIAKIQRDESVIPVFLAMSHPIRLSSLIFTRELLGKCLRPRCYLQLSLIISRLVTSRSPYLSLLDAFSTCPSFFSSAFDS